jgi:hypothetical protein
MTKQNENEKEILNNLKKVALSHYGIANYCFWFVILYPNLNRSSIFKMNGYACFFICSSLSVVISLFTNKYIINYFNKQDYVEFRKFCLKRGINSILL